MKDMRSLETRRLIKEAEYLSTELEYRSEMVRQADAEFMAKVGELIEEHPEMKKGIDAAISLAIESAKEAEAGEPEQEEREPSPSSPSMKKAFREVAKKTHPDICGTTNLSGLWMKASEAHDSGDIATMSSICESLGIEMPIGDEEIQMLKSSISSAKERISFIESTFSWNWMREQDPSKKEALLREFIARKIR